jgi:hypothetical protein
VTETITNEPKGWLVRDAQQELTQMAANTIVLDRVMAHCGPEIRIVPGMLKAAVVRMINHTGTKNGPAGSSARV